MDDLDFMKWIYERMVEVHGEDPNLDYMRRFRSLLIKMTMERWSVIDDRT